MATYKFTGNNRYFNGICTNDLVFDNKDSSEKRLFCEESTCVSAKYSGIMPITSCRTEMLPAGYTDKIFEWGVEGGPWTTNINYNGRFPSSPNEFIGAGSLSKVKPPVEPGGNFYYWYTFNNRTYLVFNSNAFSNEFDIHEGGNGGYAALGGGGQFTLDPAGSLGANSFEPGRDENNRCSVSALRYNQPEITYYDVGVNPTPPEKHDVVFPEAFVNMPDMWLEPYSTGFGDTSPEAVAYRQNWIVNATQAAAAAGHKQPYGSGHPPIAPLSAFPEWNYNHVVVNNPGTYGTGRVTTNSRGAKVTHPLADTNNTTQVIKGATAGPEWHTGYRMQRYKQTVCSAKLGANGNNSYIGFGYRDIETRIKAHGYYAKWTLKSIEPDFFIITNSFYPYGGGGGLYHRWAVKARVTVEVTYHKFNASIHPAYNYEYGPKPSTADPYYCNGAPSDYGGWNPPFLRKIAYGVNNCAPFGGGGSGPTTGDHFVYGFVNFNIPGTKLWTIQSSHTPTTAIPSSTTNPLSLKAASRVGYYTLPMSWNTNYATYGTGYVSPAVDASYIAYQGQKFTSSYGRPSGGGIITTTFPGSPNDFKIWRRKV